MRVNCGKYSRRKCFCEISWEVKCARQQPTSVARKLGQTIQDENVRSYKLTTKTNYPLCNTEDKNSLNSGSKQFARTRETRASSN